MSEKVQTSIEAAANGFSGLSVTEIVSAVLILAAVVVGVILLIKILMAPVKKIFKFLLNMLLGMGILFLINLIGKSFSYQLDINLAHCAIAAIFGVPGVVLMVLIKLFF